MSLNSQARDLAQKTILGITGLALLTALLVFASNGSAMMGEPQGSNKVPICHVDGQGRVRQDSVNQNAEPAHMAHGDFGLSTFYRDADGDGLGDPNAYVQACAAPPGYVDNSDDCDDSLVGPCEGLGSDLIVTNVQANQLFVLTGNGSGGFNVSAIGTVFFPNGVAVADVNGDGLDDFVATHKNGQVFVGLNDGSGGFSVSQVATVVSLNTAGPELNEVVITDMNHDGHLDLAVAMSSFHQDLRFF